MLARGLWYTETDAAGRFVLRELDPGTYHFAATFPDCQPATRENVRLETGKPVTLSLSPAAAPGAARPALSLSPTPRGAIAGVIARPDGTPLGAARAGLVLTPAGRQPEWDPPSRELRTDAAGRFRHEGVRPGAYRVEVRVTGYPRVVREGVTVRPGATAACDLRLSAGQPLRGRVLKRDGSPAAGAIVRYRLRSSPSTEAFTLAGADGAFDLPGLGPGAGTLDARLPDTAPEETDVVIPWSAGRPLEIRLRGATVLRGTVRDDDGKPIARAQVEWHEERPPDSLRSGRGRSVLSGAGGEYRFENVPASKIRLVAWRNGYSAEPIERDLAEAGPENVC